MAFNKIVIKTNASQETSITIADMGITIPASGGSETLTDKRLIVSAARSRNLVIYCTDDAYGSGSSTLILNDGYRDVPQIEVDEYLRKQPISQVWEYTGDPSGFVNRTNSEYSFVNGTRTFTIQPKSPATEYIYFIKGLAFIKTSSDTVIIPDITGLYYIYFDKDELKASTTIPDNAYNEMALIAIIYWQSATSEAIYEGEERHGADMDGQTTIYLHLVEKSKKLEGGLDTGDYVIDGNGSLDSHAQISISNGTYIDHDIRENITDSALPTALWEQVLDPIAQIPIYYKDGTSWKKTTADNFPLIDNSPNTCYYNYYNSGTEQWSLVNTTNMWHFAVYVFASSHANEPIIGILGEANSETLIKAGADNRISNITWLDFPYRELAFIARLVFQTDTSYTNTPKAALRQVTTTEIIEVADRYVFIASYGGNAGTGRYLEIFPSVASNDTGFYIPEDSYIRTLTLRTDALNTGTISVYLSTDLVNPIANISLTNEDTKVQNYSVLVSSGGELVLKVSSGSMNKPSMSIYMQTVSQA